jgi:hypothetical protein
MGGKAIGSRDSWLIDRWWFRLTGWLRRVILQPVEKPVSGETPVAIGGGSGDLQ